jgi:hypothetical protein
MGSFKFFKKNSIDITLPEGILNGYYNHNIPYDNIRPYYKSYCGVDFLSEINVITYNDISKADNFVNVIILGVVIDNVVYCSETFHDEWEFPDNLDYSKKYIFEYISVPYFMMEQTNVEEDAWEEVMHENNFGMAEGLTPEEHRESERQGVYIEFSNRIELLEEMLRVNL